MNPHFHNHSFLSCSNENCAYSVEEIPAAESSYAVDQDHPQLMQPNYSHSTLPYIPSASTSNDIDRSYYSLLPQTGSLSGSEQSSSPQYLQMADFDNSPSQNWQDLLHPAYQPNSPWPMAAPSTELPDSFSQKSAETTVEDRASRRRYLRKSNSGKIKGSDAHVPPKDRPYSCTHCSRSFTRKYDLERHERLHTGDKPYKCAFCHKSFTRVDARQRHYKCDDTCAVLYALTESWGIEMLL
ncbi:hypothetical protein K7432_010711 [Basidiobolus ranarum]|uniref:C2H2-type domain-containing protein n=1 Tax=Basidiobolus ranarum TaxID=34480 RepID=A0ABR2WNB1_9FUNG